MKVELLAPAGSYESLTAAINAGADAVYIGGNRFGARAFADNPKEDELLMAIDECHLRGKNLYLTVNTLLKDNEMSDLYEYLRPYYEHGLNAVIVQDMGVFSFIKKSFPDLPIHASTQMTVTGSNGAKLLKDMGAARVVTARELSLKEIHAIHQETDIEIESFIHGALCYCYSGQCLYSSLIGGRSGNRGRCAQPCRLPYDLYRDGKKQNKDTQKFLLSPKDMCTLDLIPELIESGIYSFKIEGRMKKPVYTAGVVRIYRKYIDLFLEKGKKGYRIEESDKLELMDLYNRGGFSSGYYRARNGRDMISLERPNHAGTSGARLESIQKGTLNLRALEELNSKDVLEAADVNASKNGFEFTIKEPVAAGKVFSVKQSGNLRLSPGQNFMRTRNNQLISQLEETYIHGKFKEKINGKLILLKNLPAILEVKMNEFTIEVKGAVVSEALNQPLSMEKVEKQMRKTGNTPFQFLDFVIEMEPDIYLPIQDLNELRRDALESLTRNILKSHYRKQENKIAESSEVFRKKVQINEKSRAVVCNIAIENLDALEELIGIKEVTGIYLDCCAFSKLHDFIESKQKVEQCHKAGKKCYYIMPHIFREETKEYYRQDEVKKTLLCYDGILLKSLEELEFLKDYRDKILFAADQNLYTFNHASEKFFEDWGISYDTAPLELNDKELRVRGCQNSEVIVYGHLPMMVSAQCLKKNTDRCDKVQEILYLKDRKNKEFPVKTHCQFCYNTIYNGTPLVLLENSKEILSLSPRSIRLSFTVEKKKEVVAITQKYIDAFYKQSFSRLELPDFTRGHFKRGVE